MQHLPPLIMWSYVSSYLIQSWLIEIRAASRGVRPDYQDALLYPNVVIPRTHCFIPLLLLPVVLGRVVGRAVYLGQLKTDHGGEDISLLPERQIYDKPQAVIYNTFSFCFINIIFSV